MRLLTSSFEPCRTTFSYPSQSECYFGLQESSSGARLFHTPLSLNATFEFQRRSLAHDFFTPLSVRMLLWTSSVELWGTTFHTPLNQNDTFDFKLRAQCVPNGIPRGRALVTGVIQVSCRVRAMLQGAVAFIEALAGSNAL